MKQKFYKVQASGNDFILLDNVQRSETASWYKKFAIKFCAGKTGIGADGILVAQKEGKDLRMRIFNADGSEAEMCGNGARAFALWAFSFKKTFVKKDSLTFKTKAGMISAKIIDGIPQIRLSDPVGLRQDIELLVNGRNMHVQFINTGVPHTVVFVEKTDLIDVDLLGETIRYHKEFQPAGTNVNFLEILGRKKIKIRTYERGVGETLACGTGSAASAIIFALKYLKISKKNNVVSVLTKSGTVLTVSFDKHDDMIDNVWLKGAADIVFSGELENI